MLLNLVYGLAILLLSPWLLIRSWRTGRYRQNLPGKLLGPGRPVADGTRPVLWFHGVSVGEVHLLRALVQAFRQSHPEWQVVVSSTTDTGLAEARKHFSDLTVIPYPFDFTWSVRRAIVAVQPRMIVLAESELWPNFLQAADRAQVPVVVANGRMSPRTFRRYSRFAGLARRLLFGRVTLFGMQSEGYAENLRKLGVNAESIRVTGNVKYDGVLHDRDNPKTRNLAKVLGVIPEDLVWVAGSTHDPEERVVLSVYQRLRKDFPGLKLILVPRSPDRFDQVAHMIASAGLSFARRSRWVEGSAPPVILIDTLGELGAVWGLASIGFTGGSLNERRGGQSMIEPAAFGVPVLFGPHTWNFRDAVAGLREEGGAIEIQNELELEQEVAHLLADSDLRARMGAAGRAFVLRQQGATARTVAMMDEGLCRLFPDR